MYTALYNCTLYTALYNCTLYTALYIVHCTVQLCQISDYNLFYEPELAGAQVKKRRLKPPRAFVNTHKNPPDASTLWYILNGEKIGKQSLKMEKIIKNMIFLSEIIFFDEKLFSKKCCYFR